MFEIDLHWVLGTRMYAFSARCSRQDLTISGRMVNSTEMKMGARQRNKAAKRERIRLAALKLFSEQGYESTTMRQVAREANVALGTLSLYATDKRDLSLLAFNQRIGAATTRAAGAAGRKERSNLEERLVTFFAVFYREFSRNLTLGRIFLQLNYYASGMNGADYLELRARVAAEIEALVKDARRRGEVCSVEADDLIARHFFYVFSAAVRWWISEPRPKLGKGLDELARVLHVQIRGLRHPEDDVSLSSNKGSGERRLVAER